ncbi:MAG: hypothetical protein HY392_05205 [Candidatus Diapherotrites archaeon]|nr:hypothetical protein [Candidatus Diapherotrites archaeon]
MIVTCQRAQGGLEYLLLVGGVLIVGFVVYTVVLSGTSATEEQSVIPNAAEALCVTTSRDDCNEKKFSLRERNFLCFKRSDSCHTFDGVFLLHMDDDVSGGSQAIGDSSYSGYSGTLVGDTNCTVSGKTGLGCGFDGYRDSVDFGDVNSVEGIGAMTVSFWLKLNAPPPNFYQLIEKIDSQFGAWYFQWDRIPPNRIFFKVWGMNLSGGFPRSALVDYVFPEFDTGWHHYVSRYDGSTIKLYRDGQELASKNASYLGGIKTTSAPLCIGASGMNGVSCTTFVAGGDLNGSIDEVAIWNRAISEQEIKLLYNNGKG